MPACAFGSLLVGGILIFPLHLHQSLSQAGILLGELLDQSLVALALSISAESDCPGLDHGPVGGDRGLGMPVGGDLGDPAVDAVGALFADAGGRSH